MKLKVLLIVIVVILFSSLIYASNNQSEKIKVFVPKGLIALPFIKTAETENLELIYYNDLNTEVLPELFKNKNYLFVLPLNVGAKLKTKGEDLLVLEILSKGMIYLISTKAKNIKDLNNEECGVGAPGSSPDVISQFIFKKNNVNIKPKYGDSTEIAKLMIASKINHAVLPEPLSSMVLSKNKNAKRIIDFTEEWKKITGMNFIPQTALFVYNNFYYKNRNIIDSILTKLEENTEWIINNPEKYAEKGIKELQLTMDVDTVKTSIKFINFSALCSSKQEVRKEIENYLNILNNINPELAGGKLPDDSFYTH